VAESGTSLLACTLGEGSYHAGTGGLANSLHASGFSGTLYIGCRGELPDWAEGRESLALPGGMRVVFKRMHWARNPNFEKAAFMLSLLEERPDVSGVAYFDSDVVVRAEWRFFESWGSLGVGLCMDNWPSLVPQGHPWRVAWAELASRLGHEVRHIDYYCNAGFALVPREHKQFLEVWCEAVDAVLAGLSDESPTSLVKYGQGWEPFSRSDQDAMAVAMMATSVPLSILGPDGMSFTDGANVMTHAVNKPKPWHRTYVREAVRGFPPLEADRAYWEHAAGPLPLFAPRALRRRRISMRLAVVIGSVFRRPRFWGAV
jgi:hypothetical protein